MSPREVLVAAKALIDTPKTWGKGRYYDPRTGRRCAIGAIQGVRHAPRGTRFEAHDFLHNALPPRSENVFQFNDAKSRRHRDIMALYDRAIALAGDDGGES